MFSVDSADAARAATRAGRVRAATWARASVTCFALSVAVVLVLHLALRGRVNPVHQVISDYALSGGALSGGAVGFALSTLTLAMGTVFLLAGLSAAGIPVTRPVRALSGVWSAGLALCAFFPTDPTGAPLTVPGQIHRYAGIGLFVSLPGATRLLARRMRQDPSLRELADRVQRRTRWAVVALVVFTISQLPLLFPVAGLTRDLLDQGLAERFVFVVYLALLGDLALAAVRSDEGKPC